MAQGRIQCPQLGADHMFEVAGRQPERPLKEVRDPSFGLRARRRLFNTTIIGQDTPFHQKYMLQPRPLSHGIFPERQMNRR
jgi:hypothetical protein